MAAFFCLNEFRIDDPVLSEPQWLRRYVTKILNPEKHRLYPRPKDAPKASRVLTIQSRHDWITPLARRSTARRKRNGTSHYSSDGSRQRRH